MTEATPETTPEPRDVTPLTAERARAAIKIIAKAVLAGEPAITYSDLARRLGMAKVNGQGLNSYLIEAAAICAEQGLPNVGTFVVSQESLQAGAPMPAEGSLSDIFYAKTGLDRADVPAEQARVRGFDWASIPDLTRG